MAGTGERTTNPADRLGRGLVFPLRRAGGDFESGTGPDLIQSNIRKVLMTDAATQDGALMGEYPWRLEFGSQLSRLRHANIRRVVDDLGVVYAAQAVATWEPRAFVSTERSTIDDVSSSQAGGNAPRSRRLIIRFGLEDDVVGSGAEGELLEMTSEAVI